MKKLKESSAPQKVRKNSKRTAKRRINNGSATNRKMVAKRKSDNRKANYNSRNIRNANWVYQENTPVGGIRGAILSAVVLLTVFFGKSNSSASKVSNSQTDGKKSSRRISKIKNNSIVVMITLPKNSYRFVMVTLPNSNQIITALLKIPRSFGLRGDRARAIINACSANPNIVILPATITSYLLLLSTFVTAQTNMQTGTRGTKPIRDNAWQAVENALKALCAAAQATANTSPLTAIAIIESGSFYVKSVSVRKPNAYNVTNTTTSGIMKLAAPGASRVAFHIWEKSTDGVIWTALGNSHTAKMSYGGFAPVSKVWVRHRTDTNGVLSAWQYFYVTVS